MINSYFYKKSYQHGNLILMCCTQKDLKVKGKIEYKWKWELMVGVRNKRLRRKKGMTASGEETGVSLWGVFRVWSISVSLNTSQQDGVGAAKAIPF